MWRPRRTRRMAPALSRFANVHEIAVMRMLKRAAEEAERQM